MRSFLLPAILGDEPQLAAFRQRLEGRIEFELLELPGLKAPADLLSSMSETARLVVDDIVRRQPTGAIAVIGFSFGASLALEVAAQLARVERAVSFLGVLDGAFSTSELKRSKTELLRLCLSARGIASLGRHFVRRLSNRARILLATRGGAAARLPSTAVEEALLIDYRCKALNSWEPPPCLVPGLLIFSGSLGPRNRSRWESLCPNLAVLDVAAKHGDFLKGRSLDLIVQALDGRGV